MAERGEGGGEEVKEGRCLGLGWVRYVGSGRVETVYIYLSCMVFLALVFKVGEMEGGSRGMAMREFCRWDNSEAWNYWYQNRGQGGYM